ncbi:MAG TPA: glycosyltransferase family 2 protein [Candidatus Koribacter sp.]
MSEKTISILTPCFNEEGNVREVYERVRAAMLGMGKYRYEHLFIDNRSTDSTFEILKELAERDKNVKVIRNTRNFGHIRSPMHALHQTRGDCVIGIVGDLQDPPEMIPELVQHWEEGFPVVACIKSGSEEHGLMFWIRKKYYRLVNILSGVETYENFTGFGLYDRKVIDAIKQMKDPYPYFRGLVAEIGYPHYEIPYHQPVRTRGITKNNWYTLYDAAMLGITNLSKVPLRLVSFAGFVGAFLSLMFGLAYFAYKLIFWAKFTVGVAPLVIGMFFLASMQLLSLGIIGEYIGQIHTQIQNRPFAFESERLNFEYPPGEPSTTPLPLSEARQRA